MRRIVYRIALVLWLLPPVISIVVWAISGFDRENLGLWLVLHSGPTPDVMSDHPGGTPWLVTIVANVLVLTALRMQSQRQYRWGPAILAFVLIWYALSVGNFLSHVNIS